MGRPTALVRGNGAGTSWSYAANTRNWSMTQNLTGTANDLTLGFTFSPAPQVTVRTISNTAYSYAPPTLSEAYARDGLNRYTAVAGQAFTYDDRQNLTDDGPDTFHYDLENRLIEVSGTSAMTLAYDPLGRLKQTVSGATTTRFLYDGDRLVGEYNGAGAVTARYAHGSGVDAPLVWYEGATLTDRRWLHADAQGSIIATSGATGAIVGTPYSYSPYGEPDATHGWGGSRFRYTGQISLRHAPLWHYKARACSPELGRFLQTDPVGYEDQMNLYAYVANDPLNGIDPSGMEIKAASTVDTREDGTTLTTVRFTYTAALSNNGGNLRGNDLADIASALESQIEGTYSGEYTDNSTGNTTIYEMSADIVLGPVTGTRHSISIEQEGTTNVGGALGRAVLGVTQAYISDIVFRQDIIRSHGVSYIRTGTHEVGHNFHLDHPGEQSAYSYR